MIIYLFSFHDEVLLKAQFNKSLRPRKPEGSLGRTAQDVHLDSHTAPELDFFIPLPLAGHYASSS